MGDVIVTNRKIKELLVKCFKRGDFGQNNDNKDLDPAAHKY